MTAKEYLSQIRKYDNMINSKLADIYRLKTMACSMSIEPNDDRVQSSISGDRLSNTVAKIVDMENEVDVLVDTLVQKRNDIISKIDSMENDDYREVLTHRFVLCKSFDSIYEDIHMSRRNMFRVYDKALKEFEIKFKDVLTFGIEWH